MKKKGFTLVELLAVIAIIAILVIVAMPNVLKIFRESRINVNLIVAENYAKAGESYYSKKFGQDVSFNGATNIASKLNLSGKRADTERVFINRKGEIAVYLTIDGGCYYKTMGAEKAQYTENVDYCQTSMFMAGTPVIPVNEGDGIYYDEEKNKLIYKSDEGQIGGKIGKTYCNKNLIYKNGSDDCDSQYLETNVKYSELTKFEDNINNWIYFNCKNEEDISTCEKWRIVSYQYSDDNLGKLRIISPDIKGIHYDPENLHVAETELNYRFEEIYYSDYVTSSAQSLIDEDKYYYGDVYQNNEDMEILFSNDVIQMYKSWNLETLYDDYDIYNWGYLDTAEWFEASTNEICKDGIEHNEDYTSSNIDNIRFSECNNWLNDGSFFKLSNNTFVGELGTISNNLGIPNGVRPVVTLKQDTQIISGDGTKENPYMLKYTNVKEMLTSKEQFVERVKKLYEEAKKSSLSTLYSEGIDKYKVNGFDDLQYVIQKESGNVVSIIAKDKTLRLYKIEKGSNFDNITINDITEYSKTSEFESDKLLGLDSVHSWDKKCSGKNTLNCKIVQSANKNVISNNDFTDENNDGLGGRIYYYNGSSSNVFVRFAGFCWKIVRTNENSSTKLVYSGKYTSGSCPKSNSGINASRTQYNTGRSSNSYVGYMYGNSDSNKYDETHKNNYDSYIKTIIDNWYSSKLLSYSSKIANTIYCNDRSVANPNMSGHGQIATQYLAQTRSNTYKCVNKNDQFTLSKANGGSEGYGNNNLKYPIALLTIDEVRMSGISKNSTCTNCYLSNGSYNYWTMTPYAYYSNLNWGGSAVWEVNTTPRVGLAYTTNSNTLGYVLPAISLKSNVIVSSGNGTATNPYIIN